PAYERLLAIEPSHLPALQALHHIYAAGNRWKDLVDILRAEADQTMDRWRRITLLNEIATVQREHLDSPDDALATYLEVLGYAPAYQPALMATGRLLTARGDYERLLEIHRQEFNNCEDPTHRSWLLINIGRILSEHLDRPAEAAETFREALQVNDGSAAADLLVHLYERVGDDRQLAQLVASLPLPDNPPARARYHRRIAEALIRSDRPPLAIEHLQRALSTSDDDASADDLVRLYSATGDRQSLLTLYQRQARNAPSVDLALDPLHNLARLWASADHDLHHAAETYEAILSRSPRDPIVLRQLEVILTRLGDWESLTSVIALESEPSVDPDYRTACALTIAAFEEHRLDHLALATQASVEVLERAPTNPEALATLERHARQTSNSERLLQVLSRHLRRAQTVAEQAATLCAMAAVHANRREFDDALDLYRMAANQTKSYLPAPRGWRRAAQQRDLPEEIALALESEARALIRPAGRAKCDLTAAKYWRKLGNNDQACDALQRVLDIEPTRVEAIKLLHTIYKATKRYQDLAALYEHQIRNTEDSQKKRDLLTRKADVQRRHLQDILGARHTTNRALEIFPDDPQILSTLAELCRTSEDWRALAKVNQRLVSRISDPVLAKALHFELGRLWEERLGNPRRAIAEYREVLESDESDLGALSRLADLLFDQEAWADAVDVTERLVRRDDDRGRVKNYHLRLAQIYADGLHDIDAGMRCCRRALAMDPGDLEGTDRLAEFLERKGDARGLHAHIESCLTVHRARLDRDPFAISSYQALESVFSRQGQRDHLHVVRSLLSGIGAMDRGALDALDALRRQAPSESTRSLTDDEFHRLILHPMERGPLFEVLTLAKPILRKIHGHAERSDERGTKITARSRPELARIVQQIAKALGAERIEAFVIPGGIDQLRVEDTAPPSLFIGEDLDDVPLTKLRFRLAQAIASIRLGHGLPYRLGAEGLGHSLAALLSATCTTYTPAGPESTIRDLEERITKALGRRLRARLEPPALELVD
ncbi:MAG: hypothetical protein KAI47_20770, partial [Deltaproteobacteria bacterium]|nr:hypothetical protein [Deltaproteobacteria bacterium]